MNSKDREQLVFCVAIIVFVAMVMIVAYQHVMHW